MVCWRELCAIWRHLLHLVWRTVLGVIRHYLFLHGIIKFKIDNVGLLVEAPFPRARADRVFLTIDLTEPVLEEALSDPSVGVIMAYHPPLFRPIKCLTMADTQQRIALKCSASGVSVYAPHTSLDACQNGINDWLTSGLGAGTVKPIVPTPPGPSSTGMGRLLSLSQSVPLDQLIHNVKNHLGLDKCKSCSLQYASWY